MSVADNIKRVLDGIGEACLRAGRDAGDVRLMAVSKFHPAELAEEAAKAGVTLFGALKGVGFKFQGANVLGIVLSPQLLDMLPYFATILALVIITRRKKKEYQAPASLGTAYFREER
jgi:ABC-type uncharacterized transport system permease subunit